MTGLRVSGLSFRYPGAPGKALEAVSFEAQPGQLIALLGPNGCGKSTLLKLMAGILSGNEGDLSLDGRVLAGQTPAWRARRIAYVGHDLRTEFPITAWDTAMLGRSSFSAGLLGRRSDDDRSRVRAAMERALCWELRGRSLSRLSGGERQLVAIARALAQEAPYLLLDEALSQMDLNHQAGMGRLLRSLASDGYCVILVSHDVNLAAEWADRCILLKGGALIASGRLDDTLTEARLRMLYPGADLFVAPNPRTGAPKVFFGPPG